MSSHALVTRFAGICNGHDPARFDEVVADEYRQHNPMVPDGLTGLRQGFQAFLEVFPDLSATVEAVVAEGDLVAARFSWQGTHMAEFLGVPSTGRRAHWSSVDWWRVADDKFVEHWDVVDWSGLVAQLGPAQTPDDGPMPS